jgi:hypothetical protein
MTFKKRSPASSSGAGRYSVKSYFNGVKLLEKTFKEAKCY